MFTLVKCQLFKFLTMPLTLTMGLGQTSDYIVLALYIVLQAVIDPSSLSHAVTFKEHPEDVVANVGDSGVVFHCAPPVGYTPNDGFFFYWIFYPTTRVVE